MVQVYNEVANGNLERCLSSLSRYCDAIQIYDDGSTDEPHDIYVKYNCDVIWGQTNSFKDELAHKQAQLDRCKELGATAILRLDCDENIETSGEEYIRDLLKEPKPSWAFHTINLWRHPAFYRLDNSYNAVVFNRLWHVPHEGLKFKVQRGLHLTNYPIGVTEGEGFAPFEIIHWGFASDKAILDKYKMYKEHGQYGPALDRLIDERGLVIKYSLPQWFHEKFERPVYNKIFGVPIASLV